MAQSDPRFQANVSDLHRVLPADLGPGDIEARLGAAWIDATVVQQFLRDLLDDPDLAVEHPGGQVWAVKGQSGTVLAVSTWGTPRYPAPALAQALLEQRKIEVRGRSRRPVATVPWSTSMPPWPPRKRQPS
jgi:N12 class adenine-specific DNA methylase